MQVVAHSNRKSASLTRMPLDILKGILGWIDEKSIDACMLRQTSSAMKWVLTHCLHWKPKINVNVRFDHQLDEIHRYLPHQSAAFVLKLNMTSLQHGNLANFKYLCGSTVNEQTLWRYLTAPIKHGHLDCLKSLLDMFKGKLINADYDGLLASSCLYGHREMAEIFLSLGANVQSQDNLALNLAASKGHMHIVTLLCIHGADVYSKYASCTAAAGGYLNVLVFLHRLGANVAAHPDMLTNACMYGHLHVVKFIISVRTAASQNDETGLRHASARGYLDIVKYLHTHGTCTSEDLQNAAIVASSNGNLNIVQFLYSVGVNIHIASDLAFTSACEHGHLDVAAWLDSVGADIHSSNDLALQLACENGHANVAQYLYSRGLRISDEWDVKLEYLLSNATRNGYLGILQFFHSIEPITLHLELLQSASKNGHLNMVVWLHSIGFDIHYDDNKAIRTASRNGSLDVVKFLHSVGADIHAAEDDALQQASEYGHLDIVVFLHSVGANIDAQHRKAFRVSDRMLRSGVAAFLRSAMEADEDKARKLIDTVD